MLGMFSMLTGRLKPVQAGQSNPSHNLLQVLFTITINQAVLSWKYMAINTVSLFVFLN